MEFSENWVRIKLLGLGLVTTPPAPLAQSHQMHVTSNPSDGRHMSTATSRELDYSPKNRTLALPPIRDLTNDYGERLDLPSLSKMTTLNGLHTPEEMSRSPSPLSTFSDNRYYPNSLHPSIRHHHAVHSSHPSGKSSYPTPSSQDDYIPSRGRVLTLEHGLPRTAASLRSTSRQRAIHPHHHHPYPQLISGHALSIRSRPASPLSVITHHSHSPSLMSDNMATQPRSASSSLTPYSGGPSPSCGQQQRFPSHVPNVPSSVVAWDANNRGWVLKLQHEIGYRTLPSPSGQICWHRELDEWEFCPLQPEAGRIIWNRNSDLWELHLLPDEDVEAFLSSTSLVARSTAPTHLPAVAGVCAYDSEQLNAWMFHPTAESEAQLPVSPCVIVWDSVKKLWGLLPDPPQPANISWSHEDKTWHFTMPSPPLPPRSAGRRPSSSEAHVSLPPMVVDAASPVQSYHTQSPPIAPVALPAPST